MNMLQIVSILSGERDLSKQCPPIINEYLAAQERRVIKIKQDGNCFYSALSVQLFGTQDENLAVRNVVYRMVLLNKSIFKPFFIPTSKVQSFEELCEHNWKPGIWATQVEVVAAATIFQVPIYFISPSTIGHKWNVIHPLTNPLINYPCFPDIDGATLLKPSHFELLYYENSHYDAVVALDSGRVSTGNPILTGSTSELIDLCD